VEGIPYSCTVDQVRAFFATHGIAAEAIKECRLPVWPDTGRLRGYGHVVLASVQLYQKALLLSGKHLDKRYLTLQPANAPKATFHDTKPKQEPSNTLILNNLSYDATEDDIETVLKKFGRIADGGLRLVRHNATKRSRGFCYVEFVNRESATKAFASPTNSIIILKRPCRVDYDGGGVTSSFRTSTGRLWQKQYGKKNSSNSNKKRHTEG
jgi:nucleolin